ncbi:hypothetical protein M413DRAFT_443133 [Hebeloma cylindrosporum]|uniref:F-box domain-containing protein n=1 Tax=Hebeloma cylindrosporum TaxID=76867 RepID=A0A0C2YSV8_HEBCY|nr:hypothetical protein M413DRAFT_443133 [Hebeloma cylindrosporum h7]
MINLLAKSSRQWRCIDFHIPFFWYPIFTSSKISDPSPDNDQPTQSVALKKPLDLPLLVSASFHYEDHGIVATDDEVDLDLTLAPSLHTLSLSLFQMSPALLKRITCKDKVTMMVLQRTTGPYMDLNDLLPHFPNLQEAAFHSAWFIMQNPPPDITHRKLRKLEVDAYFGWRDLKVLFLVIFPRLESLSVQVPSTIRYGELLKGFIAHNSESHLTSLSLSCKITREHELIDVLSALGSLRELYIQDTSVGGTPGFGFSYLFFDALHPDEPDTMTSLEVLSYKGNLLVQSIAFLTPVIIRSRMRGEIHKNLEKLPVLRKVRIQADQLLDSDESRIADYPDPPYVCEVRTMMERGILELLTMDGGQWE